MRDTLPSPDGDPDESETLSYRAIGPAPGNRKEIHNHYTNGSHKLVWVWACGITSLFCGVIGGVVLLAWSSQNDTNRAVAAELKTLAVAVGKLEATVASQDAQR